jgi:site-specific DNA-methyltransferase (adenine-specific)
MDLNKIYNIDCIEGMKQIKSNYIDLIITSPPYNLGKEYANYKDDMDWVEYKDWCKKWISECYRILSPDGRFCLNVLDSINKIEFPASIILGGICLDVGFKFYSGIIWYQGDKVSSTAWGSWKSASNPTFINSYEHILIFYKDTKKKIIKGEDDITSYEFKNYIHTLWKFSSTKKTDIVHPAPFPKELSDRLIKLLSFKGDLVFDPFVGGGTTCLSAKILGRKYLGFDISKEYVNNAIARLNKNSIVDEWI